jgi:hypothetical protein
LNSCWTDPKEGRKKQWRTVHNIPTRAAWANNNIFLVISLEKAENKGQKSQKGYIA